MKLNCNSLGGEGEGEGVPLLQFTAAVSPVYIDHHPTIQSTLLKLLGSTLNYTNLINDML